jgi:hypothetical protein
MTRKTDRQASQRKETSQRAPSAGNFMGDSSRRTCLIDSDAAKDHASTPAIAERPLTVPSSIGNRLVCRDDAQPATKTAAPTGCAAASAGERRGRRNSIGRGVRPRHRIVLPSTPSRFRTTRNATNLPVLRKQRCPGQSKTAIPRVQGLDGACGRETISASQPRDSRAERPWAIRALTCRDCDFAAPA